MAMATIHPEHTVESLMKLIADLNGWGYQSSNVTLGYMQMRVFTAQDESHLDHNAWGWTAFTTLCGETDGSGRAVHVSAQGEDLLSALRMLACGVVRTQKLLQAGRRDRVEASQRRLVEAGLTL